ncbi:hypothetical protein [uncultured Gilvimarinus sp.]|uniref:hypothetical protein n=1 Tax=uncultured Gilvimarinus sp. TaxID=1689143 RepID=UPI0030EE79B3|tara:strand:- start:459 stop:725 length:267 start_codon:yes stop_codon:yes gene_type:complete
MTEQPVFMRASNSGQDEAVREINEIIRLVRFKERNGEKVPGAVLYLGHKQFHALNVIDPCDRQAILNDTFLGYPFVRVLKESWLRFSV